MYDKNDFIFFIIFSYLNTALHNHIKKLMLINVAETKEKIKEFVGDDINSDDLKKIFNHHSWKFGNQPIRVNVIEHLQQCILLTKFYPRIQDYVFDYLKNNTSYINQILSFVCTKHSSTTSEMLQFLIDNGANINSDDYSSLHLILNNRGEYSNDTIKFIELLIDNGVDVNKLNELDKTPIEHFLSRAKIYSLGLTENIFKEIIRYLLSKGATYDKLKVSQIFKYYKEKEGEIFEICESEWNLRNIKPAKRAIKN